MTPLTDLLARLEAAEGPVHLTPAEAYRAMVAMGSDTALGDAGRLRRALAGSFDAALALVERVLPRWAWMVGCAPDGGYFCTLQEAIDDEMALGGESDSFAKTPALALLKALILAKSSNGER